MNFGREKADRYVRHFLCLMVLIFRIYFFVLCGLTLSSSIPTYAASIREERPHVTIDIVAKAKTLQDVARMVSAQTGYQVQIPKEWNSLEVRGRYLDIPVEKLFFRIVRKKSISVVVDEKRKSIRVESFQDKVSALGQDQENLVVVDPMTGILKEDLSRLQDTQIKELKMSRLNKDDIDPETGIIRQHLNELHVRQLAELERLKKDPDAVDPETGLRRKVLRELHVHQMAELEKSKSDPEAIDPETGIRWEVLHRLQDAQEVQLMRNKEDPDAIDPETGIRRGELASLRKQQLVNQ